MIVSDTDIELARKCILYLVSQMKRFVNDEYNQCPVSQPYASIFGSALPGEKGTDNRIANRIFDFINIIALSHVHLRCRLKYGNETLVIANVEKDLDEVIRITQNVTGMPTFKVDFFRKYVLPPYKSKTKPDEGSSNDELKESIIGITTRELADYYKKKTGKSITTNNVKETYFDDYINNG
jgi:hypothetical protein